MLFRSVLLKDIDAQDFQGEEQKKKEEAAARMDLMGQFQQPKEKPAEAKQDAPKGAA